MNKKLIAAELAVLVCVVCVVVFRDKIEQSPVGETKITAPSGTQTSEPYVKTDGNNPRFSEEEKKDATPFESYSELDGLGRCGVAFACVGKETMPTDKRGPIGDIKPSGWHSVRYDFIEGKYLYNRCHLIGYQLTAENANERNLITGTRRMNMKGMLPFENMVADYIRETGNHVLYRVTPVFIDKNLVASGVYIEAYSVEDDGDGICFFVYVFNNQPGVKIDYLTGDSAADGTYDSSVTTAPTENEEKKTYVLNTSNGKFHLPSCDAVGMMKEKNRRTVEKKRSEIIAEGYSPCGSCNP